MAPRSLFKDYGGGIRQRPPPLEDSKQMEQITLEALAAMDESSIFFAQHPPRPVPNFKTNELQCGRMIGMGEFGLVCRVEALHDHNKKTSMSSNCGPPLFMDCPEEEEEVDCDRHLRRNSKSCSTLASLCWSKISSEESKKGIPSFATTTTDNDDSQRQQNQLRSDLMRLCSTGSQQPQGACRVAFKKLRPDLYFKKKCEAARDLGREAKLLKSLDHPNIVKLHGIISQPGKADFGILLDCLSLTLREQMRLWKEQEEEAMTRPGGIRLPFWSTSTSIPQETQLLVERLVALLEVAQAMRYLHQQLILFRDLKPQNVARNPHTATNPFQLFDFGLAKELKAVDRLPMDDGNSYHLTGLTGTLRIMAPEVIQCQPYGLSADVYSFGVLLYEVVSGTSHNLTAVETCKGERPPIPKNSTATTPAPLATLLQSCWAQDPQRRPTFEQIGQTLQLALETTTTTSTAGEKSPTSKMAASSPPSPTNTNTALLSLQQQQ